MTYVAVKNVSKFYGTHCALKAVSLTVNKGTMVAILGANGAGKSTLISLLCTLTTPTSGQISLAGDDLTTATTRVRAKIGVVFQQSVLDERLSVYENLQIRNRLYQGDEVAVERSMTALNIGGIANRCVGALSGGQRRRADIARALLPQPEVLFLDEPTTGLDAQTRRQLWSIIKAKQRCEQLTIVLTTHYLEEAEQANYIYIIDQGQIVREGTPSGLKQHYTQTRMLIYKGNLQRIITIERAAGRPCEWENQHLLIVLTSVAQCVALLQRYQTDISRFEVKEGSLEDVYLGRLDDG